MMYLFTLKSFIQLTLPLPLLRSVRDPFERPNYTKRWVPANVYTVLNTAIMFGVDLLSNSVMQRVPDHIFEGYSA